MEKNLVGVYLSCWLSKVDYFLIFCFTALLWNFYDFVHPAVYDAEKYPLMKLLLVVTTIYFFYTAYGIWYVRFVFGTLKGSNNYSYLQPIYLLRRELIFNNRCKLFLPGGSCGDIIPDMISYVRLKALYDSLNFIHIIQRHEESDILYLKVSVGAESMMFQLILGPVGNYKVSATPVTLNDDVILTEVANFDMNSVFS